MGSHQRRERTTLRVQLFEEFLDSVRFFFSLFFSFSLLLYSHLGVFANERVLVWDGEFTQDSLARLDRNDGSDPLRGVQVEATVGVEGIFGEQTTGSVFSTNRLRTAPDQIGYYLFCRFDKKLSSPRPLGSSPLFVHRLVPFLPPDIPFLLFAVLLRASVHPFSLSCPSCPLCFAVVPSFLFLTKIVLSAVFFPRRLSVSYSSTVRRSTERPAYVLPCEGGCSNSVPIYRLLHSTSGFPLDRGEDTRACSRSPSFFFFSTKRL